MSAPCLVSASKAGLLNMAAALQHVTVAHMSSLHQKPNSVWAAAGCCGPVPVQCLVNAAGTCNNTGTYSIAAAGCCRISGGRPMQPSQPR